MAKYKWPELRRRFIASEWISLIDMSNQTGIPLNTLNKRAAAETWHDKRREQEAIAEQKAMERLTTRLVREAEKRIPGWLDLADALKFKALQSLTDQAFRLDGASSVRAVAEAVRIEAGIFRPDRKQVPGQEEVPTPSGNIFAQINLNVEAPGKPAKLTAPAPLTEITDADLIAALGKANLAPRVVEAKAGVQRGRNSGRAAKAKERKAGVPRLPALHVPEISGRLASPPQGKDSSASHSGQAKKGLIRGASATRKK